MLTETRRNSRTAADDRQPNADERLCAHFAPPAQLLIMKEMNRRPAREAQGFTLVELLVTVAIVGILAAIALPAFTESIRKSRRAEAISLLVGIQQAQERFRANSPTYATSLSQLVPVPASTGEHYRASITSANATSYTLTAQAQSGSPQAQDNLCSVMQLVMATGGTIQYGSGSGDSAALGTSNPCWSR